MDWGDNLADSPPSAQLNAQLNAAKDLGYMLERLEAVNRHRISTPDRHAKGTPVRRVIPVVHRRDPRATRSALTSDGAARVGGACAPTGVTRGGGVRGGGFLVQARFLKRQLSLPVWTISQ
jgi:hypothetical protein